MSFSSVIKERAIAIYNERIIPKLTPKNKVIAISVAITMSIVYVFQKALKPPKNLRHIRHVHPFSMIRSILIGETFWSRAYRVYIPLVDQPDNDNGLYLEYGRAGWEVFICSPDIAKEMLLKQDIFPKFSIGEGNENTLTVKFIGGPNMGLVNGNEWKLQRKVANPAFHRSMPVKLFGELTVEMFKVMETMGETINFSNMMGRWTLEALGKAGFGFEFNAIQDENSPWVRTYDICNAGLRDPVFFLLPKLDTDFLWMFPKRTQIHKEMDRFVNMLQKVIENKRSVLQNGNYQNEALEENERDLLSLMIESENRGEGVMTNEELISNLRLFFLAGHDTTASALSFSIHYLAKHPEMQQKAREEAIDILSDDPIDVLPTVPETKRMVYINQIMLETLRINGPLPNLIPRCTSKDTHLGGTFIPKGVPVNVGLFNIHHSEKLWKDSCEFNPDRFSPDQEENKFLLAFGYGGRQCIGMNFSLNEQRVMLSMLLRKFTWSTPENSIHKNGVITHGYFSLSPHNLDINFKKRY